MRCNGRHILSFALLLSVLCSCSVRENQGGGSDEPDGKTAAGIGGHTVPKRLMLAGLQAMDSARAAAPVVVDRMLAQAFDSIPETEYVPMSRRSELGLPDSAISAAKLAEKFGLDGVLSLRVARFGSVVGVDMGVIEPVSGREIFRDRAFSFIRYRDQDGTLLFGPALYEALDRLIHRLAKRPDSERMTASAQPILISNVVIDRDDALGKIAANREKISTDGVRALGDFMRLKYPELVVFDYDSRSRVYETVGVGMVEDHEPVNNLEREAMFNLDLPYYLTTEIVPAAGDSVEIGAEVRYILSSGSDSLVTSERRRYPRLQFERSTLVKDVVTEILEVADEALLRHANRIRAAYPPNAGLQSVPGK